jgi:hypothetical protein
MFRYSVRNADNCYRTMCGEERLTKVHFTAQHGILAAKEKENNETSLQNYGRRAVDAPDARD